MKKSSIFKGASLLAVLAMGYLLFKFVPFEGILNIGTWALVFMITVFAVGSLWLDIDILDDSSNSLRTIYENFWGLKNTEEISEEQKNDHNVITKYNELSLDDITVALKDTPLYDHWITFISNKVNTCTINGVTYLKNDIHYTLRVEQFLIQLNRYLWRQQMPQLLTGLGIFGTFLGLTIGLYRLDIFSNGKELIHQMGILISSSGTAFFTSLAGIGFSLFYTITLIEFTKNVKKEYNKLIDHLHLCVPYKSESEYLGDIITGNAQSAAQLVTHVQGIEQAFVESMDKIVKGVGRTVGKMVSKEVQNLQDKVDCLNQTVTNMTNQTQTFSAAIKLYNDAMIAQKNEIFTFTESIKEEVINLSKSNVDTTKNLLGTFEQYMVNTSNNLVAMGKMQEVFNLNLQSMQRGFKDEISKLNSDYITQLKEQGNKLESVIKESIQTVQSAEQKFLDEKTGYLKSYVDNHKELAVELIKQLENQNNLNAKVKEALDIYKDLNTKILEEIELHKETKYKSIMPIKDTEQKIIEEEKESTLWKNIASRSVNIETKPYENNEKQHIIGEEVSDKEDELYSIDHFKEITDKVSVHKVDHVEERVPRQEDIVDISVEANEILLNDSIDSMDNDQSIVCVVGQTSVVNEVDSDISVEINESPMDESVDYVGNYESTVNDVEETNLTHDEVNYILVESNTDLISDKVDSAIEKSAEYEGVKNSSQETKKTSETRDEKSTIKKDVPKMTTYEESNLY